MVDLNCIKKDIQNIAHAISSALKIDVTIVDENLVRIAGTGSYVKNIGEQISDLSAFGIARHTGESFIIENPRIDDICKQCSMKGECSEWGEVCCPIMLGEHAVGVIGLIAFDEEQKGRMVENKKQLLDFVNRMSELISSKLKAEKKTVELKVEAKRLQTLLNNMDKAVVSVDSKGKIDRWNQKFIHAFKLDDGIEGKSIFDILDFIKIDEILDIRERQRSTNFIYKKGMYSFRGIYNINPIILEDNVEGFVFDFLDTRSIIKDFNEIATFEDNITFDDIVGNSREIQRVKEKAKIASVSSSTILITGDSGTGKELFARSIHNSSLRRGYPFIAINCAAIPEALLESELFGYEEGAFTGAKKGGKMGKFELADKGTIFLDEIGDMSLHLQAKLLRVLQERKIEKIGSDYNIPVDVRIIAATNKDLGRMVKLGEFRDDLYYRLNVIPINVPSLEDRKEDVPLLVENIINECSEKLLKNVRGIEPDALEVICEYSWPGNVRELQNVIEYSVNMNTSGKIALEDIPERILSGGTDEYGEGEKRANREEIRPLAKMEKDEIIKALDRFEQYKSGKEKAAKALGISRATLYRKIKEYGI
ncbi:Transcriptional regulator containing PAS, AAA-type ATPase, and DNA-binding Fis domains [Peptoclostridium litorale DSM 5388]|uniref:Bacterial regulatory, Fis family protein n=1 Tax=Peptoclostridium litorale DSM 5388 TaxID=1121324 RepID=A0A069R9Y0_PEPLI|nr:sigma 54-interacting transcriptional regulator [Peptoclostridium litorale]KDR93879.1 bacterial regulatory, Fis family protein [Peptoclostridium litorale DSM 5388]KDR95306.1 bacterial regulatory, Fis family protein [Peptoclostridium litorale DSM 5388]SIN87743.1 Transcriptional regulator containing PAS, AAA-type ATPase, and DNA-binding Fis domains [Peptoclostridium litorale DSM 5388]